MRNGILKLKEGRRRQQSTCQRKHKGSIAKNHVLVAETLDVITTVCNLNNEWFSLVNTAYALMGHQSSIALNSAAEDKAQKVTKDGWGEANARCGR